jgi:uncharacterized membrane protein YkoI
MRTVKNTTMLLGMFLFLFAFVLSGNLAHAAATATAPDVADVCEEAADGDGEVQDDEASGDQDDAQDKCEQAESAKLAKLVAVSETKARQVANDGYAGNGAITEIRLARDDDNNNVSRIVYEIEFTEKAGTEVNVKVDAMTGAYLGVDTEDDEVDVTPVASYNSCHSYNNSFSS